MSQKSITTSTPNLTTQDGIMTVATHFGLSLKTAPNGFSIVLENVDQLTELQALGEMLINAGVKFSYVNNESIFVPGPITLVESEQEKILDAAKKVIKFCQKNLPDVSFIIDFNGSASSRLNLLFDLPLPVPPTPIPGKKMSLAQITCFAREFGLGTDESRSDYLLIQKVWTDPAQVVGFSKMLLKLKEFEIQHFVEKAYRSDGCCYIRVPYKQENIFVV